MHLHSPERHASHGACEPHNVAFADGTTITGETPGTITYIPVGAPCGDGGYAHVAHLPDGRTLTYHSASPERPSAEEWDAATRLATAPIADLLAMFHQPKSTSSTLPVTPHSAWREPKLHADDLVEDPRGAAYPDSVQTAIRNLAIPSGHLPDGQRAIPLADVPALLEAHAQWWQTRLEGQRTRFHASTRTQRDSAEQAWREHDEARRDCNRAEFKLGSERGRADAATQLSLGRGAAIIRVRTIIANGRTFGARATVRAIRDYLNTLDSRGIAPTPDADQ